MFGLVRAVAGAAALLLSVASLPAQTLPADPAQQPAQVQAKVIPADAFDLAAQHQALAPRTYEPAVNLDLPSPSVSSSLPVSVQAAPPAQKALAKSLPDLVSAYMHLSPDDAEHECLAGAVYFEAKGEPLEGQLAVAAVVLNRVRSGKYPPTICGVVTQRSQFSFVRGGRIPTISKNSDAWRRAVAVAHIAQEELASDSVGDAMFFHARYVAPNWRRLTRVASIGNHIFYSQ